MKKLVALILAAVLTATLFTGCSNSAGQNGGGGTDDEGGSTKFTVWMLKNFSDVSNQYFVDRSEQFGAEKGIDVTVEMIPYAEFLTKWTAAIESGETPDVTYMGYQEAGMFAAQGVLMDLSDVYQQIDEREALYPSLRSAVSYEGAQYAIPYWTEPIVLHYRKDLLEKAGYTEPPKTWEEFREIAKACNDAATGVIGAGVGFGKNNSDAEWFARAVIWSYGGALFSEDGTSSIVNSKETEKAVQLISDMFLVDKSVAPSAVNWDDSSNNNAYLSGQAAMVINAGSIYNNLKTSDEELYAKTGVATLPSGPAGRYIPGVCNNLAVFKNTENAELAKEYLLYMTEPESYREWLADGAPLTCPIYESFKNDEIWQDPVNKAFIDTVDSFVFLGYKTDFNPAAGEVYTQRMVNDMFQQVLVEQTDIPTALQNLQDQIDAVIGK